MVSNDHGRTQKCDFSLLDLIYPFWANLENPNRHFQLKFGTGTNSNMHKSMVMFIFFLFSTGNTLYGQIWCKTKNYQFKLKFSTSTNLMIVRTSANEYSRHCSG